ncbi:MAG: hypothetical protein HDKAJFGB_01392 [Anaerolineae bacterium]|nr:hypothetical protein [Anaerolineae bacterium]
MMRMNKLKSSIFAAEVNRRALLVRLLATAALLAAVLKIGS